MGRFPRAFRSKLCGAHWLWPFCLDNGAWPAAPEAIGLHGCGRLNAPLESGGDDSVTHPVPLPRNAHDTLFDGSNRRHPNRSMLRHTALQCCPLLHPPAASGTVWQERRRCRGPGMRDDVLCIPHMRCVRAAAPSQAQRPPRTSDAGTPRCPSAKGGPAKSRRADPADHSDMVDPGPGPWIRTADCHQGLVGITQPMHCTSSKTRSGWRSTRCTLGTSQKTRHSGSTGAVMRRGRGWEV